ncbi:MAG: lytic transglycosylase domain-containing protein [Deltaproteobacteria bacterium]|nr:lytic transglycosylase domain-containing protein [Deltaproteobacteria bacterium]
MRFDRFIPMVPLGFGLALALALGCSGAPSGGKRTAAGSTRSIPSYSSGKKGSGTKIATEARSTTLNRRGSWKLTSDKVQSVSELVVNAAKEHRVPRDLLFGIIWVESRFNPEAVSPVGAKGLMQLMPRTADYLADCIDWSGSHDSFDPDFNITAGSYYIARLIKQFDGDVDLALAAYNAGPTKVRRWMKGDGLPRVSIEYHTMVQTARSFFGGGGRIPSPATDAPDVPTDDELDRLGLAILIAGLSDTEFGLEREDDATPFD